jgi:hypothetical protein
VAVDEGGDLTVEQQVVRHVVEGLRGELVRELVEAFVGLWEEGEEEDAEDYCDDG